MLHIQSVQKSGWTCVQRNGKTPWTSQTSCTVPGTDHSDSGVKLSFVLYIQRIILHAFDPNLQSWWMNGQKHVYKGTTSFYKLYRVLFRTRGTSGHTGSAPLPSEHLQQLTKLLWRQKERGVHGANFRVCLCSVDEGSIKTPSTATTESWIDHRSPLVWLLVWTDVPYIEVSKEETERVSLWLLL